MVVEVGEGAAVGRLVVVGVGKAVGTVVGTGVDVRVAVALGDGLGVTVTVGVGVTDGDGVAEAVSDGVGVGEAVAEAVSDGVGVGEAVAVLVAVVVAVGVQAGITRKPSGSAGQVTTLPRVSLTRTWYAIRISAGKGPQVTANRLSLGAPSPWAPSSYKGKVPTSPPPSPPRGRGGWPSMVHTSSTETRSTSWATWTCTLMGWPAWTAPEGAWVMDQT
jgi:hypothetical protein